MNAELFDLSSLTAGLRLNAPALTSSIKNAESELSFEFPRDYVEFLLLGDGGVGRVGDLSHAIFWKVEELFELNNAYEVAEYAPGILLFGSNGGGEAFGFDRRFTAAPIVQIPFVGMSLDYAERLAGTFMEFLKYLANRK